ncbi:MAG TPA: hypothetical protein VJN93_04775 [Candidatus Acidoferrum sp.]|nr:hypothetical protein [Candidatus Acidoferrum sp.]
MAKVRWLLQYALYSLLLTLAVGPSTAQQPTSPELFAAEPSTAVTTPGAKITVLGARRTPASIIYFDGSLSRVTTFPDGAPPVVLRYTPTQESFSMHEPIVVLFSATNNLPNTITLTLGAQDIQFFEFALSSPAGQQVREYWNMNQEVSLVTIGSGKRHVPSGKSYQLPLLMDRWFHFENPGTYFLDLRLSTNIEASDGSIIVPQSRALRLTIRPRDAARLKKVCADLAANILRAKGVSDEREPALRLGYINDPIAVPFLAQVLSHHMLNYNFGIDGLERIGTDQAIRVLLLTLKDKYGDMALLARHALERLQDHISDPALKEAVKRALTTRPEPQGS